MKTSTYYKTFVLTPPVRSIKETDRQTVQISLLPISIFRGQYRSPLYQYLDCSSRCVFSIYIFWYKMLVVICRVIRNSIHRLMHTNFNLKAVSKACSYIRLTKWQCPTYCGDIPWIDTIDFWSGFSESVRLLSMTVNPVVFCFYMFWLREYGFSWSRSFRSWYVRL